MGVIRDAANETWRDYKSPNSPDTGAHDPPKSDIRATMGIIEDVVQIALDVVEDGLDPGVPFDISRSVGTAEVRLLPADSTRVALSLQNVSANGGTLYFTTNGSVPTPGVPGTRPLPPGGLYNWGIVDVPRGPLRMVADQEDVALTADYSSSVYNPPGLLNLLDAFVVKPNETREGDIRDLWKACVDAGLDIAAMNYAALIGATEQCSLLNWPDGKPMVNHGMTFEPDGYFLGDGEATYIDTLVPLPGGGASQNNIFMAVYTTGTAVQGNAVMLGFGAAASLAPKRNTTTAGVRASFVTAAEVTVGANSGGLLAFVRVAPDEWEAYFEGVSVGSGSTASVTLALRTLLIGANNSISGATAFADLNWLASMVGGAPLGDRNVAMLELSGAVTTYLTAIGAIGA